MKIAIDCRGINWYHGTGIGTYTDNLVKNIINSDTVNQYRLFWSGKSYLDFERHNCTCVMTSSKHHKFFQESYFPSNIEKENIDLYHAPQNGIGLSCNVNCKKVVTLHDLIPYTMPETVGKGYLLKFLKEIPHIVEMADGIITVSEFSKGDILKFFPMDPNKIKVTPLAASHIFRPLDKNKCFQFIKNKYHIEENFLLYLGGFSDRKNVHGIIEAFSRSKSHFNEDIKLVILGSYKDSSQKLIKLVESLQMSKHIIFAGFIPEEELPYFYNAAQAFVYPSFYEGFGLPPLEAMSCNTPVITSNTTSIPEVVKDCGLLINPYNMIELQNAMESMVNDKLLQEKLREKGLSRSKAFSWQNTAQKTIEAYEFFAKGNITNTK